MKIKNVIIMNNGMVEVFNENDEPIPELQGNIFKVMGKIEKHADINTNFLMDTMEMNLTWYFIKYHFNNKSYRGFKND